MTLPLPPQPGRLRTVAKRTAFAACRWLGVNAAARRMASDALPILCYHNVVADAPAPWIAAGGLHLPLEQFERQMRFLAKHHQVIDLEDAWSTLAAGRDLPKGAVAITFDDGYSGTIGHAGDVLDSLGLPATVFLATDYVDRGEWYWWDELPALCARGIGRVVRLDDVAVDLRTSAGVQRALASLSDRLRASTPPERRALLTRLAGVIGAGAIDVPDSLRPARWREIQSASPRFRFGGHSATHRVFDLLSLEEARADAARCRATLEQRVPTRLSSAFCYPEGRVAPGVGAAVAAAGFSLGVTASSVPSRERLAMRRDDPMLLPRLGVSAGMSFDAFVCAIAGTRQLLTNTRQQPGLAERSVA